MQQQPWERGLQVPTQIHRGNRVNGDVTKQHQEQCKYRSPPVRRLSNTSIDSSQTQERKQRQHGMNTPPAEGPERRCNRSKYLDVAGRIQKLIYKLCVVAAGNNV